MFSLNFSQLSNLSAPFLRIIEIREDLQSTTFNFASKESSLFLRTSFNEIVFLILTRERKTDERKRTDFPHFLLSLSTQTLREIPKSSVVCKIK
jgi:hypothetical protein